MPYLLTSVEYFIKHFILKVLSLVGLVGTATTADFPVVYGSCHQVNFKKLKINSKRKLRVSLRLFFRKLDLLKIIFLHPPPSSLSWVIFQLSLTQGCFHSNAFITLIAFQSNKKVGQYLLNFSILASSFLFCQQIFTI